MRARFIFEQFDSPEAREKFKDVYSKDDLAKMVDLKPYDNKFSYGGYHGKDSAELNNKINQATLNQRDYDAIGLTEVAYRMLVNEIPGLKKYIVNDLASSNVHAVHMKNWVKLPEELELDDDYSAKVDLWITYFAKEDDILDYDEGKFKFLLAPKVTVSRVGIGLHELGDVDKKGPAFGDFEKCDTCSGEESIDWDNIDNEKALDKFMGRLSKALGGQPDKEDEHFYKKLSITERNITLEEFDELIPEIKTNIEFFNKYVQNKYKVSVL